jgi:septum formation topological specificity factor MinE
MGKKKKNHTPEGEDQVNQTVFSEAGAAQGAAAAVQTVDQITSQTVDQIPSEVAELIRATLKVVIAQRKLNALSTTLSSLTKAVLKALDKYVDGIDKAVIRDFIKRELEAWGYPIVQAKVDYMGVNYIAETVMLYKDYNEIVDMIRTGRVNESIRTVIVHDGIDPLFDKLVK